MIVNIKKLNKNAIIPTYANFGDAGADLYAVEDFELPADSCAAVGTGVAMAIPNGYVGLVHPRSGMALKGITVMNAPGTVDAGYRGEVKVILVNHTDRPYYINKGDRIAQLVIQEVVVANFEEIEQLPETDRGSGGFGSTGN